MPSTLSPKEFMNLAELETQDLLLSLYIPLDSSGMDVGVKKLQLKNALSRVREALDEKSCPASESKALMQALESLDRHPQFLNSSNHGVAVLASVGQPGTMKVFGLDFRPNEEVTIGERYAMAPLMRMFSSNLPRTVLALSEGGLRMLRGTAQRLEPFELPESFPQSRDEVMKFEKATGLDPRDSTQHRTGNGMTYHGGGPKESVELEFTKRYFRMIGEALTEILSEHETVLLAGVHEQVSLFRRVNPELPLLASELTGNFETQPTEHFEHQAILMLAEVERAENSHAVTQARELGTDWWSVDYGPALEAASIGRTHILYVNEASLSDSKVEELALEVLRNGGAVLTLEAGQIDSPFLARFRWSDSQRSESNVTT